MKCQRRAAMKKPGGMIGEKAAALKTGEEEGVALYLKQ
jgi:hypothetical protein